MKNKNPVNPNYYIGRLNDGTQIELLDVLKAFNLNHNESCMVKYIVRNKDNKAIDLLKCIKYAVHELKWLGINVVFLEDALVKYDKPFTTPPSDPMLDINQQLSVNEKIDNLKEDISGN
mgnify:CR=1 FL=1|jgi:hypothetical protein|tara:strand:- start:668 stop:1024 length:357 start_codon:yes stop_codon:yes gene_type:complete